MGGEGEASNTCGFSFLICRMFIQSWNLVGSSRFDDMIDFGAVDGL